MVALALCQLGCQYRVPLCSETSHCLKGQGHDIRTGSKLYVLVGLDLEKVHQLFIIFLIVSFQIFGIKKILSCLTSISFEFTKSFPKLGVHSLFSFEFSSMSSYQSTGFLDFHKTLLKRGKWLPAAFKKKSVQIAEICQPIGRKEFHQAALKIFWGIQKLLVLRG